jgi:general secretion pathway protein D
MQILKHPTILRQLPPALVFLLTLIIGGCASSPSPESQGQGDAAPASEGLQVVDSREEQLEPEEELRGWQGTAPEDMPSDGSGASEPTKVFPGTGRFVRNVRQDTAPDGEAGDITLNFENTDLREVVKVVLDELVGENYILDPGVRGSVTMQTSRPLTRDALLPTLETLLRMNGSGLVKIDGIYHVLPMNQITKGTTVPQLADAVSALPSGYSVRIIPLRYISADEMTKILQPLVKDGSIVRTDAKRNLLVLAGTSRDLQYVMDTIRTFDVDWIAGMSVGFFELQYAKVEDVQKDLDTILNAQSDANLGNLLRIMPIESINGLLVVTPRPHYLEEVSEWIQRLDKIGAGGEAEPQLFVYRVRNGEAESLAGLLSELFDKDSKSSSNKTRKAEVAPGLTPKTVSTDSKEGGKESSPAAETRKASSSVNVGDGSSATLEAELRIVADPDNNALLIMATPRDYQKVFRVLERLDVVPLQVHVEATIVEIKLSDELKYGVQWKFDNIHGSYGSESMWASSGLAAATPGFSWALTNSVPEIRFVLNALAGDSLVNVLSAPSVMVLDNHTAKIQVGDQVPIATQSQSQVVTGGTTPVVTNSIQYRDTGIKLNVKPRVNPGGLVTMEIDQEVSSVSTTSSSDLDSPTISTRNISSTVAVQSGEAVVLGGLIREDKTNSEAGIPGLYQIPIFGHLFGETVESVKRTELVVILTPRVISNNRDARRITEDFRARLQGLEGKF